MASGFLRIFMLIVSCIIFSGTVFSQSHITSTPKFRLKDSQSFNLQSSFRADTLKQTPKKTQAQKVNIGGLFLSPTMGVAFPTGTFGDLSNSGFFYGFKLEFGFSKLYPFVFGLTYENQSNPGNAEFTTSNFLTQFDTELTYFGGTVDVLLNKYLKSNFTAPVLMLEFKYANVKRTVTPDNLVPEIVRDESIFTYAAGMMFTLYIFDIGGKYTFAGDYSSVTFNARIHIPLVRF